MEAVQIFEAADQIVEGADLTLEVADKTVQAEDPIVERRSKLTNGGGTNLRSNCLGDVLNRCSGGTNRGGGGLNLNTAAD